jgi:flagellar biosynthesis protein FlhA
MNRLFTAFSPQSFALPAGILTIIVLMVVPIPAFMLDVFFVFNIAFRWRC